MTDSRLLAAAEVRYAKYSSTEGFGTYLMSFGTYLSIAAEAPSWIPLQLYRCHFDLVSMG